MKINKLPPFFLLLALLTRLPGLITTSLWYDESFSLHQSHLPVDQLLTVARLDFTPPLWELLLHWVPIQPLWMIRIPSLIFGLLGLLCAWQLMSALGLSSRLRAVGMTVMLILPGLIWTAQDARGYSFFIFLYLAGALFSLRGNWWALATANLLLLYTHATAPVYVAALFVFALRYHPRAWKSILLASALPVLLYLPWLTVLLERTHDYWLQALTIPQLLYAVIMAPIVNAVPNLWVALGASLFMLLTFGILLFHRPGWSVGILTVIPMAGMIVVSLAMANVILYRTLMPLLIPFIIWTLTIFSDPQDWQPVLFRYTLGLTWALLILLTFYCYKPDERGGQLEYVAQMIGDRWQPGDVLYLGAGTALPFADYLPDKPVYILDEIQHPALLNHKVGLIFGMQYAALEQIQPARAWIVIPRDVLVSQRANARLESYLIGARLMGTVNYWQASPIQIYLQDSGF